MVSAVIGATPVFETWIVYVNGAPIPGAAADCVATTDIPAPAGLSANPAAFDGWTSGPQADTAVTNAVFPTATGEQIAPTTPSSWNVAVAPGRNGAVLTHA
jgi:hypothetical protein